MDAEQQTSAVVDGLLVVSDTGSIRRADFAEMRTTAAHYFGDAERIADFNLLSAGNDNLAAFAHRIQYQEHRGGVVIDHDSSFASEQLLKDTRDMNITLPAFPLFHIKFQVRMVGFT